jgi:signal transduction histidine kinase
MWISHLDLSLRWRISGLFGGAVLLLTALLTGLGIRAMAQTQFQTARASALESVAGAGQALSTAMAAHTSNLSPVVRSAARAAGGDLYWLAGGRILGRSDAGPVPGVVYALPTPAYPEATFTVHGGTWLVVAVAPVAVAAAQGATATTTGEVVLTRRLSALQSELTSIQGRLWAFGAAAALVFAALGFLFASSVAAPLERLTRAARRMSAGDLGQRVAEQGSGEVAALSRTFNEMAAQVATLDALRRRFVADAAHELRTPVAGMEALAESLAQGAGADALPEDVRAGLLGIQRESERLSRVIQQLLALARLENPSVVLSRRPIRAEDAIQEALWLIRPVVAERAIDVHVSVDTQAWLFADPDWLHRALLNVLDNAARHSPSGAPLEIAVRRRGDRVEIEVADHGPGVPEADIPRLGERFARLSSARERRTGGAGLGLAIVRDVVQRHEGEVHFANREGGGLRVLLVLPAATPAEAP